MLFQYSFKASCWSKWWISYDCVCGIVIKNKLTTYILKYCVISCSVWNWQV